MMPKLIIIRGYYDLIKIIKKSRTEKDQINTNELIDYLNRTYRHAIRKILFDSPASFAGESPIYELCMETIFNCNDISRVTVKWLEAQINSDKDLKALKSLKPDDPNIKKLQLVMVVTEVHQEHLARLAELVAVVNSTLALDDILNKEHTQGFFIWSAKKDMGWNEAIEALRGALNNNSVDLLSHIAIFRQGILGDDIRAFVRQGLANYLLDGQKVSTVSAFITALDKQVNSLALVSDLGHENTLIA
ncbi:hypothetical protein BN59_02805 [Legionella massiliensis]|uniref:Uncharacterized protein n=1 Tax=Legionella massiliensis TaxID=1034943 RepID=A0A078KVP6_9GAMM|nr:hypothetical protein [Legionella massiliensis]CDZ78495.1 hypothetical protein BN59_02805 [Legionella massiliensis]CEE14233.1 hypothetical protein BN1094_02805 [Legionella massiliensis]